MVVVIEARYRDKLPFILSGSGPGGPFQFFWMACRRLGNGPLRAAAAAVGSVVAAAAAYAAAYVFYVSGRRSAVSSSVEFLPA